MKGRQCGHESDFGECCLDWRDGKKCDAIFLAWLAGRPVGIAQQGPATLQGLAGLTSQPTIPALLSSRVSPLKLFAMFFKLIWLGWVGLRRKCISETTYPATRWC